MGKPKTRVMNMFLYNRNLVIFQDLGLSNCGRFVIQNAYRLYSISFFLPLFSLLGMIVGAGLGKPYLQGEVFLHPTYLSMVGTTSVGWLSG
jgi:hypothetical protein